MAATREDIDSFHYFAITRLQTGLSTATIDELLIEWQGQRNRDAVNRALLLGLGDVNAAGRYQSVEESIAGLRRALGMAEV
jgi:hypothetical protein